MAVIFKCKGYGMVSIGYEASIWFSQQYKKDTEQSQNIHAHQLYQDRKIDIPGSICDAWAFQPDSQTYDQLHQPFCRRQSLSSERC